MALKDLKTRGEFVSQYEAKAVADLRWGRAFRLPKYWKIEMSIWLNSKHILRLKF